MKHNTLCLFLSHLCVHTYTHGCAAVSQSAGKTHCYNNRRQIECMKRDALKVIYVWKGYFTRVLFLYFLLSACVGSML